ncbi:DNA (cytosine-5-)-methyltransferase [Mycoplasma phocimorsus]|uniref:DNA (cytosine-5-)-methyltransferase n=1 Tax=Mycoplasma phocimorsus TaxID=3045839 RepID=UPI00321FE6E6
MTKLEVLPKNIDIFTYSFPCQDLSQQGKQKGINHNTRSGLLFHIYRVLEANKERLPKVLLLENVKALVSNKFIDDFKSWIKQLDELGYKTVYRIINSTDYNSTQNRERVFAISVRKDLNKEFKFPLPIKNTNNLANIINNTLQMKDISNLINLYAHEEFKTTKNDITKSKLLNYTKFNSEAYIYKPFGFGPTLTASGANSRIKFFINNQLKLINSKQAIRYMGFDEIDANKVFDFELVSENKKIFTAGNSISVEVLEQLFREIINVLK